MKFFKNMIFRWFSLLSLLLLFQTGFAQVDAEQNENTGKSKPKDDTEFWDKVYVGGNFGAQFGTVTYVDISPLIGYRFTEKFSAGPGITYQYLKYKGYNYSTNIYGGKIFARHTIARQFFIGAEFEELNLEVPVRTNRGVEYLRDWVPGVFLGGGIYQPVGRRAAIILSVMYDLTYDQDRSPYNSPWVFNVGFTL